MKANTKLANNGGRFATVYLSNSRKNMVISAKYMGETPNYVRLMDTSHGHQVKRFHKNTVKEVA